MEAIATVDRKITEQVKMGSGRDKKIIRKLQEEHKSLTNSLARLREDDGVTPKDKSDKSLEDVKKARAQKKKEKELEFEKKQAEKAAKSAGLKITPA